MKALYGFATLSFAITLTGCMQVTNTTVPEDSEQESIVLLNITTDGQDDPQRLDMAMKLAGFSLDEGRTVAIFFNVKGVRVPSKGIADDFAFAEEKPIKEQLTELIERGAEVHVCPICMKPLEVSEADLVEGAQVTTRSKLFANIGADTAVFTY